MPRLTGWCGLVLAVVVGASTARAQQKTSAGSHKTGRIVGVFDELSGLPIPDAEVMDLFADGVARTESHGLVELSQFNSRNDSAAVRIRKVGFADTALVVMVGATDTLPVQVNLHKAGVKLPTVTVNASVSTLMAKRLEEFDVRRKEGIGHFMLGDELAKKADTRIDDVLFARGFNCPNYSVNGIPNTNTLTIQQVLHDYSDEFVGVEFYAHLGDVPTQFKVSGHGTVTCMIVLWTRHGMGG